ncbi:hypothetical protein FRC19_005975 [Serendipita sp. 401]|nr:hypothetical protein FRC19_005975 [Serendipita sp. 401]
MVEPIGTDLPLLIAQTILFVPCAPTVARLPMLLFHSSKAPIQVNDGQVTCITPGSVQHRPNVSPGELPPILKAITPDLSILSSSDEYYLYTYSPAFHAPDSTSFVFHPLTLLASSSPGVNPNQYAITIRMKDVLRILPSSVVLPLVVHQSTKIPTFLSQRRYDDPDTIYAILPNEPIRIVRMYSLPPQARAVGDEASSEQLDLVGLVTPGQAAVHTLAKTTATTTTTTGAMGIRKRGIRGSSGGGADTPSTATVIGDDDDDLGEKKKNTGGKIDSAKSGAMLTVSKSRVGAKGGVVLRRTIPVPNSIRKVFDRRGILSNVAVLALTLLFNLFVLLSSLTGLRMRLEWEKEEKKYDHQGKRESKGGRDDDDDDNNTRNGYELDQVTSTPRPNRRLPFTSSFFSSAPAPASSSPPPPRLSHFVVLPTPTIHAQSPSGSGQSTIQGRGAGGARGMGGAHAHVLYKGTHTDTLRFFVNGKALDPWSIVHTSFEFLSQSQSPSQEGQTPQSQESEKGDDFHEFLLKIEDRHVTNANSSAYNREGEGGGEGVELQIVSSY